MKITLIEFLTLILLCLTGLAGALSMPEISVLPESWLKYIPLVLIVILALKNAIYVFLDWKDDGQLNKSYKPPYKLGLILIGGLCLCVVSCAGFDWQSAAKRVAIAAAETSLQQAKDEVAREMAKANPDQTRLLTLQFAVMQAEQLLTEAKGEKGNHDVLLLPSGSGAKEAVLVSP